MRRILALLAVCLLLPASLALAEGEPDATTIDQLDASADGDTVTVEGSATFAGEDGVVVADQGMDKLDPEASGTLGYVIEEAIIGQPDVDSGDLVFTYALQDVTTSLVPELIQFYWDFGVRTASGQAVDFQVDGKASTAPLAEPSFRLRANCGTEGNLFSCEETLGSSLETEVSVEDDTVSITVPRGSLEGFLGESLAGASIGYVDLFGGIVAQPSGVVVNVSNTGYVMDFAKDYPVASTIVALEILDADGEVVDSDHASAQDGTFAASFADLGAGTYTVEATACYGADDCDSRTVPVTVE